MSLKVGYKDLNFVLITRRMKVEQLYTGCLAQGAYYIESNGEAAIIDPLRTVDGYVRMAKERGAKIKYIFETHFHADFVSGHVTLAKETGAPIIYGPTAKTNFDAIIAEDGQEFKLGNVTIKLLHTPGHTMESSSYLLIDENGKNHALFSGDTLFLGDVGRPDLAQKAASMTQEELAGILYDSLRNKVMTLEDDVIVYPGHGAGSACGKNMSSETIGSIGHEKATNYALRADMTKDEFVKELTDGLMAPPAYFPLNVKMNKEGYDDFEQVLDRAETGLSVDAFEAAANETGAVLLDTRHQSEFAKGFIPKSTFIGIDGGFAPWVGALIKDVEQPILLIAEEGRREEVITRLSRVGFDNVIGYLEGGFEAWKAAGKEVDSFESISAEDLAKIQSEDNVKICDVRKPGEYAAEHIDGACTAPLDDLNNYLEKFDANKTNYIHCLGGYRSVIAISILKARGIHNVVDVLGGFKAIEKADFKLTDFVCPTTS
jgi:glyoxylase-like metal-dependent hydrolase (beta-lactamase superfamily II)/rhodanese-related sulfurtransferase